MTTRAIVSVMFVFSVALAAAPAPATLDDLLPDRLPGANLPVIKEHTYKMSGRVRALLLWVGRDDVGSGVIRWRGAGEGHAYELLIGSDPLRAPGKLNKWGYLAEEVRAGEGSVVGVISRDVEQRLSEVKAGLANRQDARPFDTIRGRVTHREAYARVSILQASNSLTYREANAVLDLAFDDRSVPVKHAERPRGVRPGFLSSVAEIIVTTAGTTARDKRLAPRALHYMYGHQLYELRLLEATPLPRFERNGRSFDQVIRGKFATGRPGAGPGSRFELVWATTGRLAGVPILISYQPKWWLHVELLIQS
jgi:hypothetical protein